MKNFLASTSLVGLLLLCSSNWSYSQKRYLDPVFSTVTKVVNVQYDSNRSVNLQPPPPLITVKLYCDIYQPTGDTASKRPVIIVLHGGSFLPAVLNQSATGSKNDSSVVEFCNRFAKMGFVAVAMDYRLGWNPLVTVQSVAAEQVIKCAFRSIQDTRNCIRFLRTNASTYKIDTSKFIVGGMNTGGYIAYCLGTIDRNSELTANPKFLRGNFTPMLSTDTLGDVMGVGGIPFFNYGGDAAVKSNIHMIFALNGSLPDSSWLETNGIPMIAVSNKSATEYMVSNAVATGGLVVIPNCSGAGITIPKANNLGVNSKINAKLFTDPITTLAMARSGGVKNVFPYYHKTYLAPWDWWDRNAVRSINYPYPGAGKLADSLSFKAYPQMSPSNARAYIDTIIQFLSPRIAAQFNLASFPNAGISDKVDHLNNISAYPNPADNRIIIEMEDGHIINSIILNDVTGKIVNYNSDLNTSSLTLETDTLKNGVYVLSVKSEAGNVIHKKVMINR